MSESSGYRADSSGDVEEKKKAPVKRDAFAELMSSKTKQRKSTDTTTTTTTSKRRAPGGPRDGLGPYIANPSSYPSHIVVYHNDEFVVIRDLFPKATLHLLLLPRDATKTRLHPIDAFDDAEFLNKVRAEAERLRALAAGELRRLHGQFSMQDRERRAALEVEPPPEQLPRGRDWAQELMCGVHAHPSMNHLHVHLISVDRYSDRLKHRKHYNSFSTPFFVPLGDFPLAENDPRRRPDEQGYLRRDFVCWRCGRNFGNRFSELKAHLAEEFEAWRRL
ncbi:DNA 5'-adenosine monophosphate hydrolase [Aspergillus saccharolyticus JOP 1030-1]|uniref:Aprataxin-like protein n=1 Tax=Aspergillus saccharolyticus JOP 1030-1 TaxID=1450539 RepID=A0A318Z9U0_9EURO|nr:histidine triad nucleotide binding protein [Aspergillus saccharolyticus JOP 1030-1]PYH44009.1 histidine triad nucleotide binding protein [Aspergillus saccharolyticus JOP 1030-1]